jgi:hypothetical protein
MERYGMDGWFRPTVILGAVVVLIALNVLEFRGKRRKDAEDVAAIKTETGLIAYFVQKQYALTQNIEQLLHMISTILFALLVALLWK